ncbi:MAG TPA: YigZ family protein [Cyclobacteriaceae bacterium]|nr:YigZ family protein [Cyclobacteriaceae bacterium]
MAVYSYRTIARASEGSYKEKGSRFLAFAYPVRSEEEITSYVEALRKKYFDARHHCFAWMLGADKNKFRAFDDGEPNHSAGDPILGQIRSLELTNVLVVVVRYFGGVKLGVGGLIAAYKAAAYDALQQAVIINENVVEFFKLKYPYHVTPQVMKLVKEFDLHIISQTFGEEGEMEIEVMLKTKESFLERIKLLNNLNAPVEVHQK